TNSQLRENAWFIGVSSSRSRESHSLRQIFADVPSSRLSASSNHGQRHGRSTIVAMCHRPQNRVQDDVELLADVLGEEAQHQIAVLLQQLILAQIAPVRDGIAEVLSAIQLDGDARRGA